MRRILCSVATGLAAIGVSAGAAQENADQATVDKPAPCSDELFRQFDFWVGEWEVFVQGDKKGGDNSVSIEENGCLLVERWTDVRGGTGQSYNYVDLGSRKWRQIWVSNWGTIDYSGGLNDDGAMVLEGQIAYANQSIFPFRGTWTLQEDGSVMQHFEQFDPEKDEWADLFVGIYKKKS